MKLEGDTVFEEERLWWKGEQKWWLYMIEVHYKYVWRNKWKNGSPDFVPVLVIFCPQLTEEWISLLFIDLSRDFLLEIL